MYCSHRGLSWKAGDECTGICALPPVKCLSVNRSYIFQFGLTPLRSDMPVSRNEKSQLMLWDARQHQFNFMRRLSWSISSNFDEKSLYKCASQPIIAKNSQKTTLFFDFKVVQGHRCWYPQKACQQCSKSMSICNSSYARLVDSSRNHAFSTGIPTFDALVRRIP